MEWLEDDKHSGRGPFRHMTQFETLQSKAAQESRVEAEHGAQKEAVSASMGKYACMSQVSGTEGFRVQ